MSESKQIDIWLQRLSHISQLGLFIFTAGAIYFTVIPLYQKAFLEEAIAKKEVELKEASAALERAYVRAKSSILKDFVYFAGAECSGLFSYPGVELPLPPFKNPLPANPPSSERLFALDVPACLRKVAEISLKDLRPEDRKLFDQRLFTLSQELTNIRQKAMTEHDEVPKRAAADPNTLPPPVGYEGRMLEFLAGRESPEVHKQRVLKATIDTEQSRIGDTYASTIRQKILTLRWTSPDSLDTTG